MSASLVVGASGNDAQLTGSLIGTENVRRGAMPPVGFPKFRRPKIFDKITKNITSGALLKINASTRGAASEPSSNLHAVNSIHPTPVKMYS